MWQSGERGGLNIDGCRVGTETITQIRTDQSSIHGNKWGAGAKMPVIGTTQTQGRFPANLILDEEAAEMLDGQSGNRGANGGSKCGYDWTRSGKNMGKRIEKDNIGGASRFFYCAKASKSERNRGCEGMEEKSATNYGTIQEFSSNPKNPNHHPTVKPITLMRYLCRLITPPNGTVLDPFMGSGTTGIAAKEESFQFIGIEREAEYMEIAKRRVSGGAS